MPFYLNQFEFPVFFFNLKNLKYAHATKEIFNSSKYGSVNWFLLLDTTFEI